MPTASQVYMLEGRFPYRVYFSKFDGEDYKFPVVDPVRIAGIHARTDPISFPRARKGEWIDAVLPDQLRNGYVGWEPTDGFILHMRPKISASDDKYAYVGRFSYEPESKQLLVARIDTAHAATIKQHGSHRFNRYVRGIYIRDQKTILIRAYFDPINDKGEFDDSKEYDPELDQLKTDQTLEMLLKNNLPEDIKIIVRVDNEAIKQFDPTIKR